MAEHAPVEPEKRLFSVSFVDGEIPHTDIEAQKLLSTSEKVAPVQQASPADAAEYSVPAKTKFAHLACYFALNLALTLYNKAILGGFRFPWLVTAVHCSTVSIGCVALLCGGAFSLTRLTAREHLVLVAFSFLYTLNIAVSNVSLYVSASTFCAILADLIFGA